MIENESEVRRMATKKTSPRREAPGRAPATNGKKTAAKATKPRRKKLEEMTDEEIGLLAWETSYKNRHKRLDQ
jgi:hypothetical protein